MSKNDDVILELKDEITKKRAALKLSEKFAPVTKCALSLDGKIYNLHALGRDETISLLVQMNIVRMSCKDLEIGEYQISGSTPTDWITDLKARLAIIDRDKEKVRLSELEIKLTRLLSSDKQIELELEAIKASL